ncbi:MAG: type II secretion system protein [bacterium]|nr:type II secretion system protein [bacterium]
MKAYRVKNQSGVTLVEAVVALFVIIVGLVSAMALIYGSINAAGEIEDELLAANLARETIEVARSIRDSNWLEIDSGNTNVIWDDGLYSGTVYRAIPVFDDDDASPTFRSWLLTFDAAYNINHDDSKVYFNLRNGAKVYHQCDAAVCGITTKFRRVVTLNPICYDGSSETLISTGTDCATLSQSKIGIQVMVTVEWTDNNNTRTHVSEERLYNWK